MGLKSRISSRGKKDSKPKKPKTGGASNEVEESEASSEEDEKKDDGMKVDEIRIEEKPANEEPFTLSFSAVQSKPEQKDEDVVTVQPKKDMLVSFCNITKTDIQIAND